jgi:hypothetical protein
MPTKPIDNPDYWRYLAEGARDHAAQMADAESKMINLGSQIPMSA